MLKRRLADSLVTALNTIAKAPGQRFYRYYLDDLNRRFNDSGQTTAVLAGNKPLKFVCPNRLTRWRVDTLTTKEPATISWIDTFKPRSVMWDIGANIGIYSIYAAVTRACRVVAFEPLPANFAVLAKNVEINNLGDTVWPIPVALNDSRRVSDLHIPDTAPGSAFAAFGGEGENTGTKLACIGYSIDDFIADFAPPFPQHMKIDVDGTEISLIRGAGKTLADRRLLSISIELDDRQPKEAEEIIRTIEDAGFELVGSFRSPMFPDSPAQNFQFWRNHR